ncbi:transglutaminaseTgpA domain-containing protein [Nocardioides caldifontis]|uniref:transglutaminase family protein n=1 Tax=Nocardioides caldifontis TaxID=2588938 RepID=UPI0011DF9E0A|nr:DUF3488 and transglutaminase-like domain-containing protein [Nocardioides caldifontis]
MNRHHAPAPASVAAALLAAATTFLTLLSWDGLSDDASAFLVPLFWVCAGVAGLGLVLRWGRVPVPVVPLVQLAVIGLALHRAWVPEAPLGGWLPDGDSVRAIGDLFRAGADAAASHPAPIPQEETRFAPVMLGVGALVAVCVDALACTFRRVPLAGLPLLAVFTVPVAINDGVPWTVFAAAATAFVLLLCADHAGRLSGWGRNISRMSPRADDLGRTADPEAVHHDVRLATLWSRASRVGLAGVGLAVLAPVLVPASSGWFDGGGSGIGSGNGDVRVDNPFVDMQRDLERQSERDLVSAETDAQDPSYLRLTVLDEFDGERWVRADREVTPEVNQASGDSFPLPNGLEEDTPRSREHWELRLLDDFDTSWLPMPYPAAAVDVEGDWRWDSRALDVQLFDGDLDTDWLQYEVEALRLEPRVEQLVNAGPPPLSISTPYTELPEEFPEWVEQQALDVTEGAQSPFERAVMLQDFFRRTGGFEYSLRQSPGSSIESLELFLGTGPGSRTGYCEQFASAMTMMARSVGIPARIAIGFLRPDTTNNDSGYVYSTHDLHAWPELYFDGVGWVRFEPTPQDRATGVPSYTEGEIPAPPRTPTTDPTASAEATPTPTPTEGVDRGTATSSEEQGVPVWLVAAPVLLLLVGLALAPRWLRGAQRRRRYAAAGPDVAAEGAWAEVRATALDLGLGWDDGATLRTRALALAGWLRSVATRRRNDGVDLDAEGAVRALEALVLAVERSRYSRTGLSPEGATGLADLARTVTAAMRGAASSRTRRRAEWLPASLWRGRTAATRGGRAAQREGVEEAERDRVSV